MRFTDYIFEEVKEIWEKYLTHPFLIEIGTGKLPKEKFKNYLVQDYLYLKEFSKVFAMGMIKADTVKEMRFFHSAAKGALEDETAIHIEYMNKLNIPPIVSENKPYKLENSSYISYMQSIALKYGIREIVMATLPCNWSYNYIGHYLLDNYKDFLENNYYKQWIEMYSDPSFDNYLKQWLEYTNSLCENLNEKNKKRLIDIFINSSLYELKFWNMSYRDISEGEII